MMDLSGGYVACYENVVYGNFDKNGEQMPLIDDPLPTIQPSSQHQHRHQQQQQGMGHKYLVRVVSTSKLAQRPNNLNRRIYGLISIPTFNVILCGISFCMISTAFAPARNLEVIINGKWGSYSLAILYISMALSSLLAPSIVANLSPRSAILFGQLAYVLWITVNIHVVFWLLLVVSIIAGFGSSIMWSTQARFLHQNSTHETLAWNGTLFFGLFQTHHLFGNLIAAIIINYAQYNFRIILFSTMLCISSFAILLVFCIKPSHSLQDCFVESTLLPISEPNLQELFSILLDPLFRYFFFITIFNGQSHAFFLSSWTLELGQNFINYAMIVFGMSDVIGSWMFSKTIPIVGRIPILILAAVMFLIGSTICAFRGLSAQNGTFVCLFIALLFGLSDAGIVSVLFTLISQFFHDRAEMALGAFRFLQTLTIGFHFILNNTISHFYIETCILNSTLGIGLIFLLILEYRPIELYRNTDRSSEK